MISREGAHRAQDEGTRGATNVVFRGVLEAVLRECATTLRVAWPTEDVGVLVESRARPAAATSSIPQPTHSRLTDDRERLLATAYRCAGPSGASRTG